MKTFVLSIVTTLVQLFCSFTFAATLPLDFILQKHALVAGASIMSIEQDVQFTDGTKTYLVRETWLIEGDRNLKLSVRGLGELRDLINLNYLYNNKSRTSLLPQSKARSNKSVSADFFEKYLAVKSKDSSFGYLKELGIINKVQLARAGGKVCFLIGEAANPLEANNAPHMWIEQDQFVLMKLRLPSGALVEFTNYTVVNGAHYPNEKLVIYDDKNIKIKVNKVSKNLKANIREFYPDTLELASIMKLDSLGAIGQDIEEFYSRFR